MTRHAEFYRNAIDLNRYSNSVTRRIVRAYNDVVVDVSERLLAVDPDTLTALRLRAILAQLKESLDTWAGASTQIMAEELQGLATMQADFMVREMRKVVPPSVTAPVRSVEVSPSFAEAVVVTDPTALGLSLIHI